MILLLNPYVDAILCLALAALAAVLISGIFKSLGGLPGVGKYLASFGDAVAAAIARVLGLVFAGISAAVGGSLHWVAQTANRTWAIMRGTPAALAHVAGIVGTLVYTVSGLRALVHNAHTLAHTIARRFVLIGRELGRFEHQLATIEHEVAKGIGEDVLPRIKSLDKELNRIKHKVIPAIEADVNAIPGEIADVETWVGDNFVPLARAGLVTAVIAALGYLGLGGLRCNSLLSSLKNRGCGLWNGLEDLLGLFVDALILTDLCAILPEAVKFFGVVEGALTGLISQAASAVCALPNQKWTTLNVAAGPRPPAQSFDPTTLASGG